MLASQIPAKVPLPFANSGTKNTIPTASQIGITAGAASLTDGFPPLSFTPLASGGVPPAGADFNGIFNLITAVQQWQSAGGAFKYDSAFSTAIGGYPAGATLTSTSNTVNWLNLVDNNTTDPDSGAAANWVALDTYGIGSVTGLTNANVTLTPAQYGKSIITLAGTLTGNVQIIFPNTTQEWMVVNNTTGAFTVTCKTAAGTGGTISQSGNQQFFWGDGTNLNPISGNASQPTFVGTAISATQAPQIGQIPGKNKIIDGRFVVNQKAYTSGTAVASGSYALDMWKSSTTNSSMTFTSAPQGQSVTITGSFQQVVERSNVIAGYYTLSWVGSSQARVYNSGSGAPSYSTSPLIVLLDGTQNVICEFNAGTVVNVQLEYGGIATTYESRFPSAETVLAQRYLYAVNVTGVIGSFGGTGTYVSLSVFAPVSMRGTPTITLGTAMTVGKSGVATSTTTNATASISSSTSNNISFNVNGNWGSGLSAGDCVVVTSTTGLAYFDSRL